MRSVVRDQQDRVAAAERRSATPARPAGADLHRAGNQALAQLLSVQRVILPMGQAPADDADAQTIAFQHEVDVGAQMLAGRGKGAVARFDDTTTHLEPGRQNYVVGHSDGRRMWAVGSPRYDASALTDRLVALGVAPGIRVRLLGCHSGYGPLSLAWEAKKELRARGIAGVAVKGALGEIVKTPGASGVFEMPGGGTGIAHNRLNSRLATGQKTTVQQAIQALNEWVRWVYAPEQAAIQHDAELDLLGFAKRLDGGNAGEWFDAIFDASFQEDRAGAITGCLAAIPPLFDTTNLATSTGSFRVLMPALVALDRDRPDGEPIKASLATVFAQHRARAIATHDAWLAQPLKPGAVRRPKTRGNITFVS